MNWKERRHKRLRKRAQRCENFYLSNNGLVGVYKGRWKKIFIRLWIAEIAGRVRRHVHERA